MIAIGCQNRFSQLIWKYQKRNVKVGIKMTKLRESIKKLLAYNKQLIAILVIAVVLMSATTFSYWAVTVSGESDQTIMSFRIGEYSTTLYEFVLTQENVTHQYEVDIEYLLEDYKNNTDDVIFGVIWNDSTLSDEFKDRIIKGDIDISISLQFYQDGEEVSAKTERTLNRFLKIKADRNNPDSITYGGSIEEFSFYTYMNKNKTYSKVSALLD